jgi:hypothetical protein
MNTPSIDRPRAEGPGAATAPTPWWRVGMVWLVLAGPLSAVLAGSYTAYIAVSGADEVLDTRARQGAPEASVPAVQGRNHAATPPPQKP